MNKVILSFDYEIYFDGKNDYQTLITNTSSILSIAKMHSIKCVFFVDSYYLIQLKHFKLDEAYEAIVNQIKQIQEAGRQAYQSNIYKPEESGAAPAGGKEEAPAGNKAQGMEALSPALRNKISSDC